jgi:cell wall-associated NlpC family hydrolase
VLAHDNRAAPIYSVDMPRFSAAQIYAYAIDAGFTPDQATTMTAIAMAESGGDSRSHATHGEDSRGLWQINAASHPDLAQQYDLYDPAQNAKAAYVASHNGTDISPWSVTHGGSAARYLRFRDEAQAAAAAHGDGPNHGVWTGTAGYGHPVSAGDPHGRGAAPAAPGTHSTEGSDAVVVGQGAPTLGAAGAHPAPGADYGIPLDDHTGTDYGIPLDPYVDTGVAGAAAGTGVSGAAGVNTAAGADPAGAGGDHLHSFLAAATAQSGDQYIFGVMDRLDDPNPKAFDCSMLVQWSAHQAGVDVPRNAWDQYQFLHDRGMVVPVDQAIHTPGALLFSFNSDPNGHNPPVHQHVAISLGDGKTIEALGAQYGVGSFDANTKRFQYAAVIPGISDHAATEPAPALTTDADGGVVLAGLADQTHPSADPTVYAVADPHAVAPAVDPHAGGAALSSDFANRMALDPDQFDMSHPSGAPAAPPPADPHPADPHAADPHAADPHAADPHAPAQEPLYFTLVDANDDGLDDSLQQAASLPVQHPTDTPHHDSWSHDDHDHGGHP